MLSAAAAHRLAGTLVWEVFAINGDDFRYDFNYTQGGSATVLKELAYRLAQVRTIRGCFSQWKTRLQSLAALQLQVERRP